MNAFQSEIRLGALTKTGNICKCPQSHFRQGVFINATHSDLIHIAKMILREVHRD